MPLPVEILSMTGPLQRHPESVFVLFKHKLKKHKLKDFFPLVFLLTLVIFYCFVFSFCCYWLCVGGWVFSSQVSMPSEEKVVRLRCQGKASLEMEAKTGEYFLHMKSA